MTGGAHVLCWFMWAVSALKCNALHHKAGPQLTLVELGNAGKHISKQFWIQQPEPSVVIRDVQSTHECILPRQLQSLCCKQTCIISNGLVVVVGLFALPPTGWQRSGFTRRRNVSHVIAENMELMKLAKQLTLGTTMLAALVSHSKIQHYSIIRV